MNVNDAFGGRSATRAVAFALAAALIVLGAPAREARADLKTALDDIELGWQGHDMDRIFRYVGESVTIDLGDGGGAKTYSRDQGYQTLQAYFGKIETLTFVIADKSSTSPVGEHTYRNLGEDEMKTNRVYLELAEAGSGYALQSIRIR